MNRNFRKSHSSQTPRNGHFKSSQHSVEKLIDWLMPKANGGVKSRLLQKSQGGMRSFEAAETILQIRRRQDVKVCITRGEQNCYSPLLNLVGLSQDVYYSQSVMAIAIAAHEVGHAFQHGVIDRLKTSLMVYVTGNFAILLYQVTFQMGLAQLVRGITHGESLTIRLKSLLTTCATLFTHALNLIIYSPPLFVFFVCRLCVFVVEVHASWLALRFLKEYKILNKNERKVARKFLTLAALTYLGSHHLDKLMG